MLLCTFTCATCTAFRAGTMHVKVAWEAGLCGAHRHVTFPILVADPDMGAGFRVHEIPFQFNLMKLLPRCQQVEMFFLMLTKGRCLFTTCLLLSSLHGYGHPALCACLPGQQACESCHASFSSSVLFSHLCSPRAVQVYCCLSWDDSFGRVPFENIKPRLFLCGGGGFLSVGPNISRTVAG